MTDGRLRLLIIGGYGVFGGRLAQLLADERRLTLLIAGRSQERAEAFCRGLVGAADKMPVRLDRSDNLAAQFGALNPDIVIDSSGPFQNYVGDPYGVIRTAIACRCHYLDLADGTAFVEGVGRFDEAAREAGVFVLSGASSFPVLTAAVVRHLAEDMERVETIVGGIAPSPYAGVGLNVIRAVSSYAGQPVALTRDGHPAVGFGLSETRRYTIAPPGRLPLRNTLFSLVDVPDLKLLPAAWPSLQSIWMGAGPVPEVLHRLLIGLAWLVRLRLLPSLRFAAPIFHRAINVLRWGEHRGGMFVEVTGRTAGNAGCRRSWHLLAEGDDGPFIPSMAVEAIVRKQLAGMIPPAGARPAIDALELADYQSIFAIRTIYEGSRDDSEVSSSEPSASLFEHTLGSAWHGLPAQIRVVHSGAPVLRAAGRARVLRGSNPLTWAIGGVFGFPPAADDVAVEVEITAQGQRETWERRFGRARFASELSPGSGLSDRLVHERFGPFSFAMALVVDDDRLRYVIRRWSFAGVSMPRFLGPYGETFETVDEAGRFVFNVDIKLPLLGRLVSYRGYLVPVQEDSIDLTQEMSRSA